MPPITSGSTSEIDRKSLKRPDDFMVAVRAFFNSMVHHWRGFLVVLGIIFVIGVATAFYASHRETKAGAGQNALYLARQTLEKELTALAPPVATPEKPKDAAAPKNEPSPAERMAFKALDVDAQLPKSVAQFKSVVKEYGSSRAGFEAQLILGNLYYDHGDPAKSIPWYQGAVDQAPGSFEKTTALYALGYAHENLSQFKEAIAAFEKALNHGEAGLKGELLLSIARCYEGLHDVAKARSTYDQIITQMANTEYAKTAERLKAQVE